jgi:hypothetical protein
MDSLTNQYRQIIKNVIQEYADFFGNDAQVKVELVLDEKNDHYLLVETGWENRTLSIQPTSDRNLSIQPTSDRTLSIQTTSDRTLSI